MARLAHALAAPCLFAGMLAFSERAHADIGVPMVAIFLPPLWLSLVPIVLLEALILRRMLAVSSRAALASSAVGNITTTIVGIPLIWTALAVVELICCGSAVGLGTLGRRVYAVTIQAPWLIPYEHDLGWMIPAAMAVLIVPFFLLTVAIEGKINRRILASVDQKKTWRATWVANAWSYLLLFMLAWPAWAAVTHFERFFGFFGPLVNWFVAVVFGAAKLVVGS